MKIIVMCETMSQFREYVSSMLRDRNKIPIVISFKGCNSANIEGIQFMYCNDSYILKGHSFSENDRIIKVGSWYNIPLETQEKIALEFKMRSKA